MKNSHGVSSQAEHKASKIQKKGGNNKHGGAEDSESDELDFYNSDKGDKNSDNQPEGLDNGDKEDGGNGKEDNSEDDIEDQLRNRKREYHNEEEVDGEGKMGSEDRDQEVNHKKRKGKLPLQNKSAERKSSQKRKITDHIGR